jgi:hypothetical protein
MKSTLIAVLGLVAVASATHVIEIPTQAFISASPKESFLKMALHADRLQSSASSVTWGECPSQGIYDSAVGVNNPEPPQIGKNIGLNLDVIFNDDADVKGLDVNVAFTAKGSSSAITLFEQDYPAEKQQVYHDGDEFKQTVSWLIPSFAPLGKYFVTIVVHGKDKVANNYVCLSASFSIQ